MGIDIPEKRSTPWIVESADFPLLLVLVNIVSRDAAVTIDYEITAK